MPDNKENEKLRAERELMSKLEEGERSAREEGRIEASEVKKMLACNTKEHPPKQRS